MNHAQFKEWLMLSVYGELGPKDRKVLKSHLAGCDECRTELTDLRRLMRAVGKRKLVEPSEQLLHEARRELQGVLRLERNRKNVLQTIDGVLAGFFTPGYRLVIGSLALVGVGILGGYLLFSQSPVSLPAELVPGDGAAQISALGEARIANVRFLDPDASDGEVEFVFEAIKPVRMKGNISDKQVQRVLAHALLNEQNPGVRLRTVSTIASQVALVQSQSGTPTQDEQLVDALIEALRYDPNDGVRKEALKVLRTFPMTKRIRDALLSVLMNDKNPGLRVDAIKAMEEVARAQEHLVVDEHLLDVLRQKVEHDSNNFIRLRAMALLEEIQR